MRFSQEMLKRFEAYKATARELELGLCDVVTFLEAHALWNQHVAAWERECCAASNYGAF
jgi:hypothetical protein